MNGIPFTYIYELYIGDELTYIGKSLDPKNRFNYHCNSSNTKKYTKMIIVDKYEDKEHTYIKKYINEGYKLSNKEIPFEKYQEFEIGTIINRDYKPKKNNNVKDSEDRRIKIIEDKILNKNWRSIKECSEHYGIERNTLTYRIENGFENYTHLKILNNEQ
jgi:hypothetical protein